jgi:hypothetical protein
MRKESGAVSIDRLSNSTDQSPDLAKVITLEMEDLMATKCMDEPLCTRRAKTDVVRQGLNLFASPTDRVESIIRHPNKILKKTSQRHRVSWQ